MNSNQLTDQSRFFCLGLSKKVFGTESSFVQSDMQFARHTTEVFVNLDEKLALE